VVNDVLDFSRLDSGKQAMARESYSVARLVEGVMAAARAYPASESLALSSDVAPDVPPYLKGDRAALSRMLLNLMHNAVKFTQDGSVSLKVRRVVTETGEERVAFSVSDTGGGIPASMQAKIFEPFEQASNGRLSPHHGSGLGLAICLRIAEASGGKITLRSEEGKGSTFTCLLPLDVGAVVEDEDAKSGALAQAARPLRVLVAEDTPASQIVIRLMLEGMGHQVRVVDDGAQALRAFGEEIFDLVFLDVQMPVMNGHEAAAGIRLAIEASRRAGDGSRPRHRRIRDAGRAAAGHHGFDGRAGASRPKARQSLAAGRTRVLRRAGAGRRGTADRPDRGGGGGDPRSGPAAFSPGRGGAAAAARAAAGALPADRRSPGQSRLRAVSHGSAAIPKHIEASLRRRWWWDTLSHISPIPTDAKPIGLRRKPQPSAH
jgi:CheY-like chemotaxis protein